MQVYTSLQTDNHTSTPTQSFTGRTPFLPPNQQRQSTEGNTDNLVIKPYALGEVWTTVTRCTVGTRADAPVVAAARP